MDEPRRPNDNPNVFAKQEKVEHEEPVTPAPRKVIALVKPPEKITYNIAQLSDFLELVFGEVEEGENVLTYFVPYGQKPCWASPSHAVFYEKLLTRETGALYYTTSTVRPDPTGKLYNRQAQFYAMHVLVLDDVGTKVPIADIPEALAPTYIIQSSPGNYQYGYVLREPIKDLGHASALVALMYASGLTDGGGAMPNKLVRLPDGLNGKENAAKGTFPVELLHMGGPLWTPQELLSAIDSSAKWEDVLAGVDVSSKSRGASKWSPTAALYGSVHGIEDSVLEWLYENKMVYQDVGDWVAIKCPEEHTHTDGNPVAYYSPLGRGGDEFAASRAFKCHHSHGLTFKTSDFLQYVSASRGPVTPQFDPCGALVRDYVYDAKNDVVWGVTDRYRPSDYRVCAFSRLYPHAVSFVSKTPSGEAKVVKVKATTLWERHPGRVCVHGTTTDPRTTERIVKDIDGRLRVNLFSRSDFGTGEYDQYHVDKFLGFLEYLIPRENERDYFIDWLAAKYQDMSFRGNCILMIATAYGVGRGTLGDMVHALLGQGNAVAQKFSDIVNPKDNFTEWMQTPLVIVNETKSTDAGAHFKASFEALKELIDPAPVFRPINTKNLAKTMDWIYTSFLMFSNHAAAIAGAENDRRIYVISNPATPASPGYFDDLKAWTNKRDSDNIEAPPVWARHVGRYLSTLKPDLKRLHAPVPMTSRKRDMISASFSDIDKIVMAITRNWPSRYIIREHVNLLMDKLAISLAITDNSDAKKIVWRLIASKSIPMFKSTRNTVTFGSKRPSIRQLSPQLLAQKEIQRFEDTDMTLAERRGISEALDKISAGMHKLWQDILYAIEDMG